MAVLDQPSMQLSRQRLIRAGVADKYPRHGYPSFSSLFPKIHIICRDGGPWQSRMGLFGYRMDRTYLPSGYPVTVNPDLGEGQRVAVHPLEMPLCDRLRGESFASTLRSVRCGSGPCHGMYVRNSSSEPAARLGGGRRRYRRPSPGRLPVAPRGQRRLARSPVQVPEPAVCVLRLYLRSRRGPLFLDRRASACPGRPRLAQVGDRMPARVGGIASDLHEELLADGPKVTLDLPAALGRPPGWSGSAGCRVSRRRAAATRRRTPSRCRRRSPRGPRGSRAQDVMPRPDARCPRQTPNRCPMIALEWSSRNATDTSYGRRRAGRAGRHRSTTRWAATPRTARTPARPRRSRTSDRDGRVVCEPALRAARPAPPHLGGQDPADREPVRAGFSRLSATEIRSPRPGAAVWPGAGWAPGVEPAAPPRPDPAVQGVAGDPHLHRSGRGARPQRPPAPPAPRTGRQLGIGRLPNKPVAEQPDHPGPLGSRGRLICSGPHRKSPPSVSPVVVVSPPSMTRPAAMITRTISSGQGQLALINSGWRQRASPAAATGPRSPRTRLARPAPRRCRTGHPQQRRRPRPPRWHPPTPTRPARAAPDPRRSRHHPVNTDGPPRPGWRNAAARPASSPLAGPTRGNQPVPDTSRLRSQPRPDHRGGIRPPDQQHNRKQTCVTRQPVHPRPTRHDPQRGVGVTDRPASGMAPPGQHPRASRTRQPPRTEPLLDRDRVGLYREHRASERNHAGPPAQPGQGQQREGRGLPRPEDRHGGGADQRGQRDSLTLNTSARSTVRNEPHVVSNRGAQHPCSARMSCDRVGCLLYPGAAVPSRPAQPLRSAPAASQRPALYPAEASHRRSC